MKRGRTTPITIFFLKKQQNNDSQNPPNSNPSFNDSEANTDEPKDDEVHNHETNIERPIDGAKEDNENNIEEPNDDETQTRSGSNLGRLTEFDIISLPKDPGLRRKLTDFHINDRDIIRREYIRRGPCQPSEYKFPKTNRNFVRTWFDKFKPWLEYSIEKDAAFCFVCYLFKSDTTPGGDAFVNPGFRTWGKPSAFEKHVGNHMSAHNNAMKNCDVFIKQKSSIACCFETFSNEAKSDYRVRLETSIAALRFLCLQGLATRGHDESEKSSNKGNFLELVSLIAKRDKHVAKVVLQNAPGNCILTSSDIQKDIVSAFAKETTKRIIEELDGGFFCILADESADISDKEQMALCLRYVDKMGQVKERLLGIVHVGDTTSLTLKTAIDKLLIENSLTISSVRGQGYDGASNMRGAINGLKSLILKESPCAYYVHCFAHQLQLTLVAVAKKNVDCSVLFDSLAILLKIFFERNKLNIF